MHDVKPSRHVTKRSTSGRGGYDPELTRRNILAVATREFAEKGYSGARVDEIAAQTNTSKRMIYYYFEDKEGLFVAVLEDAYRRIRQIEATLDLVDLEPEAAIRALVGFTFDYQNSNEDFIRLVMVENIHQGIHLARSRAIQDLNVSVINTLREIYERGVFIISSTRSGSRAHSERRDRSGHRVRGQRERAGQPRGHGRTTRS